MEVLFEDVSLSRKINTGMDAIEISGQHLGKVDGTLSVLEGLTFKEHPKWLGWTYSN